MRHFRIALLFFVASICYSTLSAQSFSIKDKSGNMLYFNVLDKEKHTVEMIRDSQADTCYNISGSLTIPKAVLYDGLYYDVVSIGKNALKDAVGLQAVVLPSTLVKISEDAFNGCVSLENIYMPGHNVKISHSAFKSCTSLKKIQFGSDWTIIDCHPFAECSLELLNVPAKVSTILGLNELKSLKSISVDKTNEYLSSFDGLLFNKAKTELLYCPINYNVKLTIPEGTEVIRNGAVCNCLWLESISLPKTLKSLSFIEFSKMRNLKNITIYSDEPIINASIADKRVFALEVCNNVYVYVGKNVLKAYREAITNENGIYTDVLSGKNRKCNSSNLIGKDNVKAIKSWRY